VKLSAVLWAMQELLKYKSVKINSCLMQLIGALTSAQTIECVKNTTKQTKLLNTPNGLVIL